MERLPNFRAKFQLDKMDREKLKQYRGKILGAYWAERESEMVRYVKEMELYENIRFPEDHYNRFKRWENDLAAHDCGAKKLDPMDVQAYRILLKLGADKMYWFGLVSNVVDLGGFAKMQYIKGMQIEFPKEYEEFLDGKPIQHEGHL